MRRVPLLLLLGLLLAIDLAYGQMPRFDQAGYARFVTELAEKCPFITVEQCGRSAAGTPLYLVRVRDPSADRRPGLRMALQAGQHGDEPLCTLAMMSWLDGLAEDTAHCAELVRQFDLACVPAVNPDGQTRQTRENATKADLNRDWLVCAQPETNALRRLWADFSPQVFVDLHDLRADEPHGRAQLEGGLLPSHEARATQLAIQQELAARLGALMPVKSVEASPELELVLAHRALAQALPGLGLSLLFESRDNLPDHLYFLEVLLEVVAKHQAELLPAAGRPPDKPQPPAPKPASRAANCLQQANSAHYDVHQPVRHLYDFSHLLALDVPQHVRLL